MSSNLMIYGATGYTGKLLAAAAVEHGLRPILAGRNAAKLKDVATPLGLNHREVDARHFPQRIAALGGVDVLLNAAGPFSTARPWVDACSRTATHYLDVAGEIDVFEDLERSDDDARQRGIMVMPGVGFLVVASDCLAAHVAGRLPEAHSLRIGTSRSLFLSRGSLKTMIGLVSESVKVRRNGSLTAVELGRFEHAMDYGCGPQRSTAMSMPELVTAYRTTGIRNIDACVEVSSMERAGLRLAARLANLVRNPLGQAVLQTQAELLPEAPVAGTRDDGSRTVIAEAADAHGRMVASRLRTPEAYRFTAVAAMTIAARVLSGDLTPGFQTPAQMYGADFVLGIDGVEREDLAARGPSGPFG